MKADDFFDELDLGELGLSSDSTLDVALRHDWLEDARRGAVPNADDLGVAIGLAQLARQELEKFATTGDSRIDDNESALVLRTLRVILKRSGIEWDLPFRGLGGIRTHWVRLGLSGSGSWQARREYLDDAFNSMERELENREDARLANQLVTPVSPRASTGWADVDLEVSELRRRFATATTAQDYRAVGTHCVGVPEAMSRAVYDPAKHLYGAKVNLLPMGGRTAWG
jgi:hypothetical protein